MSGTVTSVTVAQKSIQRQTRETLYEERYLPFIKCIRWIFIASQQKKYWSARRIFLRRSRVFKEYVENTKIHSGVALTYTFVLLSLYRNSLLFKKKAFFIGMRLDFHVKKPVETQAWNLNLLLIIIQYEYRQKSFLSGYKAKYMYTYFAISVN